MEWSNDRPTEPGKYWVSVEPGKRGFNVPSRPTRPNRSVIPIVIEMDSVSFDPGLTVYFDQRGFGTYERTGWIGKLDCGFFDGAKWTRRVEPADPFEDEIQTTSTVCSAGIALGNQTLKRFTMP